MGKFYKGAFGEFPVPGGNSTMPGAILTQQKHPFLDLTHIMSLPLPQLPLLAPQPNHSPSVSLHPLTPTLVQQNPWIPQVLIHSTLRWLLEILLHTCH